MTNSQRCFLKIIGSRLFGSEIAERDLEGISWPELLAEAQKQTVFSLAYSFAENRLGKEEQNAEYLALKYANTALNTRNLYYHTQLHKLLTEHAFRYVILKGQASAMYYPDPVLRMMGDVDFLVDKRDVEAVDALLHAGGYQKTEHAEKHEFHWVYKKDGETFELHWDVPGIPETGGEAAHRFLTDILDEATLKETAVGTFAVPSPFHHGLVLLLHTISHLTGTGVGLRHLCDWLVFENSLTEESFCSTFEKPLKEIGLWTFAQVLTRTGILFLGCPARQWCKSVDAQICEAFMEDILAGGNFGSKDNTRKSQEKLIRDNNTNKVSGGNLLRNMLISTDKRAKRDFPFARIKILLPAAWIAVLVQYAVRVASGKRNNVFDRKIYSDAMVRRTLYAALKLFETE